MSLTKKVRKTKEDLMPREEKVQGYLEHVDEEIKSKPSKDPRSSPKGKQSICIFLKDAIGNTHSILSLDRSSVLEAIYVATKGILQIVLKTKHGEGKTEFKWAPITTGKFNKSTTQIDVHNTGGVKEVRIFTSKNIHNTVDFDDDDEIRYIWEWLDNGISADQLFAMRAQSLQELADFKAKKLAEAKEKEEAAKLEKPVEGEESLSEIMKRATSAEDQATINALKKTKPIDHSEMKKVD